MKNNKIYLKKHKKISDVNNSVILAATPIHSFVKKESYAMAVLDVLNSSIAIVDKHGLILKVNKAWKLFAQNNGAIGDSTKEGANYFKVFESENTNNTGSDCKVLKGIKDVVNGIKDEFYHEYPCNSANEQRWFCMRVKKIDTESDMVFIEHNNISDRKIAQKKLNETTNELVQTITQHSEVLDSSSDLICSVDENGKFVYVNSASKITLGYEPEELIGVHFLDLVFIEDREKSQKGFLGIKSDVSVLFFENRFCHKNGTLVHLLWSSKWDAKNKIVNSIARDETHKKLLEKEIEVEKQRFTDLYLQAPCCMGILKGPNHVYEMANPLYLKLIEKEDIIGKSLKEVLPELEAQGIFKFLDDVYNTGITYSAKEMLVQFDHHGNGKLVDTYLNFIYQAHRNSDVQIDGILFFAIDVTEQVFSRRRIEEKKKKYQQIVETAQEGIWILDENNITTFVNSKMAESLGYSTQEMIGKDIFFFMDEKGKTKALEMLNYKNEKYFSLFSFKFISKSGNEIWNTISADLLYNDDKSYRGAFAMMTDITEKIKSKEKLELQNAELIKAHSELDRFVYSVSHDLRSPLTSVLGLLSFIKEESKEEDTLQHETMIRASINRLDEFIKNILSYSRNNRVQLQIETIDVKDAITIVVNSLRNIPTAQGITITITCNQTKPFYSDIMRLNTILENLISNAIKHHKVNTSDRFINIDAHFKNKKLLLTIADNGVGIAPEFHNKIFEMFYRVSGETDGTGIGLYIVKDAVERIQGTIEIQSEMGIGTVFTILLKNLKP